MCRTFGIKRNQKKPKKNKLSSIRNKKFKFEENDQNKY